MYIVSRHAAAVDSHGQPMSMLIPEWPTGETALRNTANMWRHLLCKSENEDIFVADAG